MDEEKLQSQKIIYTEIRNFPVSAYDTAYMSANMVIALCLRGEARNYFDMKPVCFEAHDISVMLPNHIISRCESSDDYRALLVIISQDFYNEVIHRDSFKNFYKYRYRPCYRLNDEQYTEILTVLNALKVAVDSKHPRRLSMAVAILDVLFYQLAYYRGDDNKPTGSGFLFQRFYDLLVENYDRHHEVSWYAYRLNLTPKYFSTTIRTTTGRSAGAWIASFLSLKAKSMIHTRHDLNFQEIGTLLGFVNITSFCRFFRRMNKMSPKEYRGS